MDLSAVAMQGELLGLEAWRRLFPWKPISGFLPHGGSFLVQLGARNGQGHPQNKGPQMEPGLKVLTVWPGSKGTQARLRIKASLSGLEGEPRALHVLTQMTQAGLLTPKEPRSGGWAGWGRGCLPRLYSQEVMTPDKWIIKRKIFTFYHLKSIYFSSVTSLF